MRRDARGNRRCKIHAYFAIRDHGSQPILYKCTLRVRYRLVKTRKTTNSSEGPVDFIQAPVSPRSSSAVTIRMAFV